MPDDKQLAQQAFHLYATLYDRSMGTAASGDTFLSERLHTLAGRALQRYARRYNKLSSTTN